MNVQQIMSRSLHTTTPDAPLSEACRLMWDHDCGAVPVIDPPTLQLVGIVTDRDAAMAAFTKGQPLSNIPTGTVMSKNVVSCRENDDLATVHDSMRSRQLHRLPVTNERGECVGLVSLNDLAIASAQQRGASDKVQVAETLAAISRHRQQPSVQRELAAGRF